VKRARLSGSDDALFIASGGSGFANAGIDISSDKIRVVDYDGSSIVWILQTAAVLRDPSAWYHVVASIDTTQATASNRVKIWINGTQQTIFSSETYPSLNVDSYVNSTQVHYIGASISISTASLYLADIHFIDGQVLDPTSFGEFDLNGIWQPKLYTGTYGTNGFKLDFADNSSNTATTLGKDTSGNGNNWTPNNLSVTAGAGNDSLVDSPTNYGTDTGVGGEVRGNYCTFNPLSNTTTLSNGNLDSSNVSSSDSNVRATIGISSGKWYWEITNTTAGISGSQATQIGISTSTGSLSSYVGSHPGGYAVDTQNGNKYNNTSAGSYFTGASAVNSVHGVAFDADNGTITFYRNGTTPGVAYSSIPSGTYFPAVSNYASSCVANFGQRPFAYTAPSGFKALCTANLPAPTITKPSSVFDVATYTGTGSTLTPTSSLGFNPDLVWIKSRSAATDHTLYDSVRGAQARLESNTTDAEVTSDNGLTAFNSNGFTLGTLAQVNTNAATYVGWTWDAGSSTVTNTQGSITSSVRANASAGFSIVTAGAGGYFGGSVGHGLSVAPGFIILKDRNGTTGWRIYHSSLGNNFYLDFTTGSAANYGSNLWAVSSTTFGSNAGLTSTAVAYCFAPVAGYSAFGSYTGNGSTDGPFVYTGFRPRYLLYKRSDSANAWVVFDSVRGTYNLNTPHLQPHLADAEANVSTYGVDFLSNGFKLRATDTSMNSSGGTYIYAAFAESPFQYARAR
jgi:hypothetical protein